MNDIDRQELLKAQALIEQRRQAERAYSTRPPLGDRVMAAYRKAEAKREAFERKIEQQIQEIRDTATPEQRAEYDRQDRIKAGMVACLEKQEQARVIREREVSFYPVMAIQAARRSSRVGGGYRLYVLAKSLDTQGRGSVSRDELRDYALSLGVSVRTFNRWVEEARNNDLLTDVQRKGGEWEFILPSAGAAAYSMGCETVGNRKASIAAADLIGKGWKARIWAAYEVTHNGKPISRERMQKIVNVPVSTQRYRDAQAGVTRLQNHAKLKDKADALPLYQDYGKHKGLYIRKDGYIGSRKPDSRYSDIATRGRKGRARKANATLHRMQRNDGLSIRRQALSQEVTPELSADKSVYIRLFNFTPDQRKATERKIAKLDRRPPDVYEYSHDTRAGSRVWSQC